MKKKIKHGIGMSIIAILVAFVLICMGMAAWAFFVHPEQLSHDKCVTEKVMTDPETGKLELAIFLKGASGDLEIQYGVSCNEYYNSVEQAPNRVILFIGSLLWVVIGGVVLCCIVVCIFGGICTLVDEKLTNWINAGEDRKWWF